MGAFIWQLLSSRGGGPEMTRSTHEPGEGPGGAAAATRRPRAAGVTAPAARQPPPAGADDISGALRIELADEGVRYLERALALRPRHSEAMIYLNLLYRQKSFALFTEPDQWQAAVDKANEWQKQGLGPRDSGAPRFESASAV